MAVSTVRSLRRLCCLPRNLLPSVNYLVSLSLLLVKVENLTRLRWTPRIPLGSITEDGGGA